MGTRSVTAALVDAGPLIHLSEIDALTLLQIFDTLMIPEAVWSETVGQGRLSHAAVMGLGNVQRATVLPLDIRRFIQTNHLAGDDREQLPISFSSLHMV